MTLGSLKISNIQSIFNARWIAPKIMSSNSHFTTAMIYSLHFVFNPLWPIVY